ncbi:MAG TPA: type II restriction endonuclease, partial [Lachnospiraceae bacterium]|nr:type II restriction endonuclease [Lachnospiraceae bacterium]
WAYKDFKIGDLFDLTTTKKKFNANDVSLGGIHPYVVRT